MMKVIKITADDGDYIICNHDNETIGHSIKSLLWLDPDDDFEFFDDMHGELTFEIIEMTETEFAALEPFTGRE